MQLRNRANVVAANLISFFCGAGIPADRQGRAGSPQRVDRAHNTWLLTRERL